MSDAATNPSALIMVVSASTLPAHVGDRVPRFVLDQALAFAALGSTVHLLAPHAPASRAICWPRQEALRVTQWRFGYAPLRWEVLTDHGIMPALRERPWLVLAVPALVIAQFFALWRLVRRVRPNVIYAHWFTPQAITACAVAWLTRTPFGFTTHASDVAVWQRFGVLGRHLVRKVTMRATFITAVSTQTASRLKGFFDEPSQIWLEQRLKIIPMGVELTARFSSQGDPYHAVIVARLVEKKGIGVLLEAWPTVLAAVPKARLTIAGAGPLDEQLRATIRGRGLAVDMPGYLAGQAKADLLASAGVVVQPSVVATDGDTDGLPVALLEGIAAGCVPVASDASGAQDIIEAGKNGYLVPSGDATALARALITAMTLPEEDRRAMLHRGRQLASDLAWPRVAREHLAVLAEATPPFQKRSIDPSRNRRIKAAFFAAIVVAFGWFLWKLDWASLQRVDIVPELLVLALAITWAYRYYGVLIWRIVLTQLGAHSLPPFRVLVEVYAKAWLARYIPGTVPWIAGKVYLAAEQGISKSRLAVSSIVEAGAQIVGTGIVSTGLLVFDGRVGEAAPYFQMLATAGTAIAAVAMIPLVFNRFIALGMRLFQRDIKVVVSWESVGTPVGLHAGGTMISGLGFVVLSHSLLPALTASDSLFLIGAFGLSGVAGMLTPLVPAGLGTRDGAQLLLLLAIMPAPEAALLVIASRLSSALVDVLFWVGAVSARRTLPA